MDEVGEPIVQFIYDLIDTSYVCGLVGAVVMVDAKRTSLCLAMFSGCLHLFDMEGLPESGTV